MVFILQPLTPRTTWLNLLSDKRSPFLAKDNIQNSRWYSENKNLTKDSYLRILMLFQVFASLNIRLEVILLPGFDKWEEKESYEMDFFQLNFMESFFCFKSICVGGGKMMGRVLFQMAFFLYI